MGSFFSKKADVIEPKFIFNALEVNEIRQKSTQKALDRLSKLSFQELDKEAAEYFDNSKDQILVEGKDVNVYKENTDKQYDIEAKRNAYQVEMILNEVHKGLKERYGDKIVNTLKWYWNNVGGTYCRIAILAFTMHEYIALWGSNISQTGFSGYYPSMDVYDIMVTGKMYSFEADSKRSNPTIYTPDDKISYLKRSTSKVYQLEPYTYMIDLGQGQIASSFWSGVIAPFLFNNQDWRSLFGQISVPFERLEYELYN